MASRDPRPLGELVRRHRAAATLSQEQLAERAGLSVRAISDLERGAHHVPGSKPCGCWPMPSPSRTPTGQRCWRLLDLRFPTDAADDADPGTHLPVPATPLVGREHEVAAVSPCCAVATPAS